MFVYLLKHKTEPRFKIGKANDVLQRISSIGGRDCYDLIESRSIDARTPENACRVERILHRMFSTWQLPVDIAQRFVGDTEQFNIQCFGAVIAFVEANKALLDVGVVDALPLRQVVFPPHSLVRKRNVVERRDSYGQRMKAATNILSAAVESLLLLNLESLWVCAEKPPDELPRKKRHCLYAAGHGNAFAVAGSVIERLSQVSIPWSEGRGELRLITESFSAYPSSCNSAGCHVAWLFEDYLPSFTTDGTSVGGATLPASVADILSQLPHVEVSSLSPVPSNSQRSASFRHALHVTFG